MTLASREVVHRGARTVSEWGAPAVAGGLALLTVVVGWRGTDLAAQVFRADLFRRYGFVLWNSQWFGGHATLSYSVLAPAVTAVAGPLTVAALSGIVAAFLFDRIVVWQFGTRSQLGSLWFAVGTAVNVVVGRVPFALGLAIGLVSVLALQRGWTLAAIAAAVLSTLASPITGLFVVVAAAAWALSQRTHWFAAAGVAAAALAPLAATTVIFPDGGVFPYEPWAFAVDLLVALVAGAVAWNRQRAVAVGAAIFAVVATAAFVVPSPLGGNISRFSQFLAGPVLACLLWPRRKVVLGLLVVPLVCWQWVPAFQTIASGEPAVATTRAYYDPVVSEILALSPVPGRVEVPATAGHWESAYVADRVAVARGWERQLDMTYDRIFYDGTLDATTYEQWLHENAVQFVALPDAPLDDSSDAERALLRADLAYLEPVWHDQHWQLWRVRDYQGLVDGPAVVVHQDARGYTLRVAAPGDVTLRARHSSHWRVDGAAGCVASTPDGWTRLRGLEAGIVTVTQAWQGTPCP